jgi:hypothetical protein
MRMGDLESRFVTTDDEVVNELVYPLPTVWWSRGYEYSWARQFADPRATVLDAACGLEHPLKFYLADTCRECHACDRDPRLLSREQISNHIGLAFGEPAKNKFRHRDPKEIHYSVNSLSRLPYTDQVFDRIFCVSVLEHLRDRFNKWPVLRLARKLLRFLPEQIFDSLCEFRRTLAADGLIILTFDFPRIRLEYLKDAINRAGLRFAADVNFSAPTNAIVSPDHVSKTQLSCFRAVLCRKEFEGPMRLNVVSNEPVEASSKY